MMEATVMGICCRLTFASLMLLGLASRVHGDYPISIPVPPGSPPPRYQLHQVPARDGTLLSVHEWAPAKRPAGQPVVLFEHGIGMHGGAYAAIAAGFTLHDIVLIAPDVRGHGMSGGPRGLLAEPYVLRADVGAVFGLIEKRYPDAPVVLVGDSMGGLLATDYAWHGERRLAGLALLVPAFGVNGGLMEGHLAELGGAVARNRVPVSNPDQLAASTRDRAFLKARLADRLGLTDVRISYLMTLGRLQQDWPKAATEIRWPLYVAVAGQDHIVDSKTTKRFFDRTATPPGEKTWHYLDKAYHTVCWDPDTPALIDDLARWVEARRR
jgi:lysophospholipase